VSQVQILPCWTQMKMSRVLGALRVHGTWHSLRDGASGPLVDTGYCHFRRNLMHIQIGGWWLAKHSPSSSPDSCQSLMSWSATVVWCNQEEHVLCI
jgi:hypothetical protein